LNILQNISLKQYNTFGIDASAQYFVSFSNVDEAQQLLGDKKFSSISKFILGGGSNILFTKNIEGLVLKNEIKGIQLIKEDNRHVYVKVAAGENWNSFVMHCIQHNYAGLENLSLIPGNVGASPMQNIGAYGVELKNVFESLEALNRNDNRIIEFTANDCAFGYRESVFKRKYKEQFVILNVIFRLNKIPVFNTSYGAVEQELERMNVKELSIKAVSQAVINIRTSKLPDPKQIGNAGSFFKNPTIELKAYQPLQHSYFNVPHYAVDDDHVKIPAAWLIEQCGWKGYRDGDAGVHPKQPLVLVNYGNARGEQIYDLSEKIFQSVKQKFGIELEIEVNIV
jgi:UDP-N-acetylmuramate dehydrogenase